TRRPVCSRARGCLGAAARREGTSMPPTTSIALLLALARPAAGLDSPASGARAASPAEELRWFTQFGDKVLSKCDAVLLGRIQAVTPVRGAEVVRTTILTWYLGTRAENQKEVTLISNPGDFFAGTEQLLFLQLFEGGPRFTYLNRISKTDPDFDAKEKSLAQQLEIKKIDNEEDRRRKVRGFLYNNSESRDSWTRWNMLRELAYVRKEYPDLVTKEDIEDLRKVAERSQDADFKKELLRLLQNKDKSP